MTHGGALTNELVGPDPLIGRVLQDRYRVVRKLGEGGMGAVYEGEHLLIKKRVAIKLLHPQFASSGEIVARFHQEALAATAIGHEHIVEVNDMGRTPEGAIFMVLEFLQGTDFAGVLEKEPRLSIGRAVHIVRQVLSGLAAAHAKGIVHRDLKPENIFLVRRTSDPDFVKVLDFGISKFQDASGGSAGRAATKTGSIMGTAYYMSPEQAQGKKTVDHRTDLWAVGVILYKALAGRYPFDDDAYPMLIVKICTETPTPIRTLRPDVPEGLAAIIDRCLTRDVEARVKSCAELEALLAPFETMTSAPPKQDPAAFAATMASAPGPIATPVNAGATEPPRAAPAASGIRPSREPATAPAEPTAPPAKSGNTAALAAGIAVVTVALGAVGLWASGALGTAVPPPTSFVEAPPSSVVDEVATVDFSVSPSDAAVLIDGRPAHREGEGHWSRVVDENDTELHELRVEATGFRTRIENVRLSYPHSVLVLLDPGTGEDDRRGTAPPAPPSSTTDPHVGSSGHHGGRGSGSSPSSAPATSTGRPPTPAPASDTPTPPPATAAPTPPATGTAGQGAPTGAHGSATGGGGESATGIDSREPPTPSAVLKHVPI
ncbi:MAG: serine/threonine-protein kinase [Sandaracinus sp.]